MSENAPDSKSQSFIGGNVSFGFDMDMDDTDVRKHRRVYQIRQPIEGSIEYRAEAKQVEAGVGGGWGGWGESSSAHLPLQRESVF